jgi:hypothetical protein
MSIFVKLGLTLLKLILVAAMGACWGLAAFANYGHAYQIAATSAYAVVWGWVSVCSDVMKVAAPFAFRRSLSRQNHMGVTVALALWIVTTLWSALSCFGFVSTILSDTTATRAQHNLADTSREKQLDDQVTQLDAMQRHKLTRPTREWPVIEAEIGRLETRVEDLRAKIKGTNTLGAPNATAANLATIGIPPAVSALLVAVLCMALLELGSSVGLLAFSPLFVEDKPTPKLPPEIPTQLPIFEPVVSKGTKPRQVGAVPDFRFQARLLLTALKTRYPAGTWIDKDQVFADYHAMAVECGWEVQPNHKIAQQLVSVLRIEKRDDGKRIHYRWAAQPKGEGGARLSVIGGGLSEDSRA